MTGNTSDNVTSAQYRLGVEIGKLVHAELQKGMTYEQALSTLRHAWELVNWNHQLEDA